MHRMTEIDMDIIDRRLDICNNSITIRCDKICISLNELLTGLKSDNIFIFCKETLNIKSNIKTDKSVTIICDKEIIVGNDNNIVDLYFDNLMLQAYNIDIRYATIETKNNLILDAYKIKSGHSKENLFILESNDNIGNGYIFYALGDGKIKVGNDIIINSNRCIFDNIIFEINNKCSIKSELTEFIAGELYLNREIEQQRGITVYRTHPPEIINEQKYITSNEPIIVINMR